MKIIDKLYNVWIGAGIFGWIVIFVWTVKHERLPEIPIHEGVAVMYPSPLYPAFKENRNAISDNYFHMLLNPQYQDLFGPLLTGGTPFTTFAQVMDFFKIRYYIEQTQDYYWQTDPQFKYKQFMENRAKLLNVVNRPPFPETRIYLIAPTWKREAAK